MKEFNNFGTLQRKATMTIIEFSEMYVKNCERLYTEINGYKDDTSIWEVKEGITNSGGNLALHLVGNLNHFIGATLGNTGYVRNRDAEFSIKGLSKSELLTMIDDVRETVAQTFIHMNDKDLQRMFPFELVGKHATSYYLVFFIGHFEYHLGQINYHRRLS